MFESEKVFLTRFVHIFFSFFFIHSYIHIWSYQHVYSTKLKEIFRNFAEKSFWKIQDGGLLLLCSYGLPWE